MTCYHYLKIPFVAVLLMIQNFFQQFTMLLLTVRTICLFSKWCADNELNFNVSKCAFICFRPECSGTLSLDGHLRKQLDATFDLGLEVS